MPQAELLQRVRNAIYNRIVATGLAPTVQDVAAVEELAVSDVTTPTRHSPNHTLSF